MAKVHIRKKALTKGRSSVYLDFSPPLRNPKTGKPQRYEFLDIFLYDKPMNVWERNHNSETGELLENIRANRLLDIQNRKFGFISNRDRSGYLLKNANIILFVKDQYSLLKNTAPAFSLLNAKY